MIRNNWFVIFTVLIISCWTLAFYVSLRAEDGISTEDETEESTVDMLPTVDDMPLLVEDIRDEVEILEELQKQNNDDLAIYHKDTIDKFDVLIEILNKDMEEVEEENKEGDMNNRMIEVEDEKKEGEVTSEDNTESYEQSTEDNSNISDPVEDQIILLQIHEDLQKVMLSIWAIAGLMLGTKLISRMFGNG